MPVEPYNAERVINEIIATTLRNRYRTMLGDALRPNMFTRAQIYDACRIYQGSGTFILPRPIRTMRWYGYDN